MKKWEYKVVTVYAKRKFWTSLFDTNAIENELNKYGEQGWELVVVNGISNRYAMFPVLTFKRAV